MDGNEGSAREGSTLLGRIAAAGRVAIQTHDNPDPDALASGFCLWSFLRSRGCEADFFYAGPRRVTKPNLIQMIVSLNIPIRHTPEPEPVDGLLVTVDCQHGAGNVTSAPAGRVATIDHHIVERTPPELADIRPYLGGCSTLVWKLSADEGFRPDSALATALYYGLYCDSGGFAEMPHPLDRDLRDTLQPNRRIVKKLIRSNLSLDDLTLAAASLNGLKYNPAGRYALIAAPPCDPNLLGFIGDLAMQVDSIDLAVAHSPAGASGEKFSVRTSARGHRAPELAAWLTAGGVGSGGGHGEKAGGFINAGAFRRRHGRNLDREYFAERLDAYLGAYRVVERDELATWNPGGMARCEKLPVELGYVPCRGLFPEGARLHIRTLEGDIAICAGDDICIMIGSAGEVYPIRRARFEAVYRDLGHAFHMETEYPPTVLDSGAGRRVSLLEHARACEGRGGKVLARQLDGGLKIFTAWDDDSYLRGEPGDWLVRPEGDDADYYIVSAALFPKLYRKG